MRWADARVCIMMTSMLRRAFVLACLLVGTAEATPNFPAAIQTHLTMAEKPDCALCHFGEPGRGTVQTPFGLAMRERGLVAGDTDALIQALDQMSTDQVDSDRDGVTDIQELQNGDNPNGETFESPRYGCRLGRGSDSTTVGFWWLLVILLRRRRTRQRAYMRTPLLWRIK